MTEVHCGEVAFFLTVSVPECMYCYYGWINNKVNIQYGSKHAAILLN